MGVWIDSEINQLKRVLIHSPGHEIEAMSPVTAREELYNDIIPLSVVADEHRNLSRFLSLVCEVFQVRELLTDVLRQEKAAGRFISTLAERYNVHHRMDALQALQPEELADRAVSGLKKEIRSVSDFLDTREFDILPLPNLLFTRDSAMVYRDSVVIGSMASGVRSMESAVLSLITDFHEIFRDCCTHPEKGFPDNEGCTLEGGDFLVLDRNLLCIGVSERTTSGGLDILLDSIARSTDEVITVFAVILPRTRAAIHLDMVCTQLDRELLLIHEPVILGKNRARVIRIDIEPGKEKRFREAEDLISGLREAGRRMDYVLCGGEDELYQEREQWLSGANMFCFSPGRVLGYGCNIRTFDALDRKGFTVKQASRFVDRQERIEDYNKLAVMIDAVELARGGGGIRCLTMPIEREK